MNKNQILAILFTFFGGGALLYGCWLLDPATLLILTGGFFLALGIAGIDEEF